LSFTTSITGSHDKLQTRRRICYLATYRKANLTDCFALAQLLADDPSPPRFTSPSKRYSRSVIGYGPENSISRVLGAFARQA
jgi:hypothetical protein